MNVQRKLVCESAKTASLNTSYRSPRGTFSKAKRNSLIQSVQTTVSTTGNQVTWAPVKGSNPRSLGHFGIGGHFDDLPTLWFYGSLTCELTIAPSSTSV